MKAALIAGGVDASRIVDLAHDLPAHGVREAAFLLREMARAFPRTTVHVAVVDPGVGGRRAPIAIATRAGPILVGPDNGVLMPLAEELGFRAAFRIDPPTGEAPVRVGTTFDGRDLFAPAAARLVRGARLSALGPAVSVTPFALPAPTRLSNGALGEVLHRDRFGNLITNVPTGWVAAGTRFLRLSCGRTRPRQVPWVTSYESLGTGALGALGSSFGLVEIAVGQGRATDRLGAGVGASVGFSWGPRLAPSGEKANSTRPRKQR